MYRLVVLLCCITVAKADTVTLVDSSVLDRVNVISQAAENEGAEGLISKEVFTSEFSINVSHVALNDTESNMDKIMPETKTGLIRYNLSESVLDGYLVLNWQITTQSKSDVCGLMPTMFGPSGMGVWWYNETEPLGIKGQDKVRVDQINPCITRFCHGSFSVYGLAQVSKGKTMEDCAKSNTIIAGKLTVYHITSAIVGTTQDPYVPGPLGGPTWDSENTTKDILLSQYYWTVDLTSVHSGQYNMTVNINFYNKANPSPWPFDDTNSSLYLLAQDNKCPLFTNVPQDRFPQYRRTTNVPNGIGNSSIMGLTWSHIPIDTSREKFYNIGLWMRAGPTTTVTKSDGLVVSVELVPANPLPPEPQEFSHEAILVICSAGALMASLVTVYIVVRYRTRSRYSPLSA
eukprot:m.29993 g.29993  ORF g.29993 m.29993 type:complete len:402 (+) comp8159_c0_seq2:334-1539(+)